MAKFLMNRSHARELRGKVVEKIERDGESVKIIFTDGTSVEISGDRPQYGRQMVYFHKNETKYV
jgi:hypothetical protein